MGKAIDLEGKWSGSLKAIERVGTSPDGQALWKCDCLCGNTKIVKSRDFREKRIKSCGCKTKELQGNARRTHGFTKTRLYRIWSGMKTRCYNKNSDRYTDYGGRGITICPEWLGEHGFENFYDWSLLNGYKNGLSIDRIDNDKGYSPDNCRWATDKMQANNRRSSRIIDFRGESHTSMEWSEITGIDRSVIENRIDVLGWSVEKALTKKVKNRRKIKKEKYDEWQKFYKKMYAKMQRGLITREEFESILDKEVEKYQ